MNTIVTAAVLTGLFLALPWLAIAFKRYCDVVNRLISRRKITTDGTVCRTYQPPTTSEGSGHCARCGMFDYRHHQEQPRV